MSQARCIIIPAARKNNTRGVMNLRLSYSAISTYQTCPMQYRFKYVDKRPSVPSPSLSFGKSLHEALRWFYDVPTPDPCSREELLDRLEACWLSEGYRSPEEEARYFYQARATLEHFYRKNAGDFRMPVALEQGFSIDIGFCELSGYIDRMDKDPSGYFEIIDYKTNRRLPPARRLAEDLQLPIYHLAAEHIWNVSPERVTFYYLLIDHRHSVPVSEEWKNSALDQIREVVSSIERCDFEPRSNPLCPWCDFLDDCPAMEGKSITRKSASPPPLDVGQAVDELIATEQQVARALGRMEGLKRIVCSYLSDRDLLKIGGSRGVAYLDGDGELSWGEEAGAE